MYTLMINLKAISFFITLVMMIQMLPLAQIGGMLTSSQWTEELPHSCEESSKDININNAFLPPDQHMLLSMLCDVTTLIFLQLCDQIPSNHSTDVVSPPPDLIASYIY